MESLFTHLLAETRAVHDATPPLRKFADWPEDLAHFCALLVTGPGRMAGIDFGLKLELINAAGFSAAANSRVPHNALHDARALRDFYMVDRVG